MTEETRVKIIETLQAAYPEAKPALRYRSAYELLVAVILSAQCTDVRVNLVTEVLFAKHNTPQTMLELAEEELSRIVFPCGLYKSKAKHILSASRDILERFHGEVPGTTEELKSLAGVGQKTANVVYSVWFGGDAIAVDTHVFRVSNRLGLAHADSPEKTELQLRAAIPKELWSKAHHWLIYHGRQVCHAQKPDCGTCALRAWCEYAASHGEKEET